MTLDLAKLKEAAEKAKAARRNLIANQDSQDAVNAFDQAVEDWCELANPATILELIERLESAEEIVKAFAGDPHIGHIAAARAHMKKHNAKP